MNLARLLPDRERSEPNGDEPILAEGQAVLRVRDDLQEEAPIPSRIAQLSKRKTAERKPAQYEWARLKGEFLISVLTLFADEQNGLYLLSSDVLLSGLMGGRRWPQSRSELGQGRAPAWMAHGRSTVRVEKCAKMYQIDRKGALFRAKADNPELM